MKDVVCADTNALSYVFNEHSLASFYQPLIATNITAISFQTVLELRYGAYQAAWGERRLDMLERFIASFIIIHSEDSICTRCAHVLRLSKKQGQNIELGDAWIAATALELELPLVTHDTRHFNFIPELKIISEQA
mgnify:CR=1 FL=1